jgi:hypothetical protein
MQIKRQIYLQAYNPGELAHSFLISEEQPKFFSDASLNVSVFAFLCNKIKFG